MSLLDAAFEAFTILDKSTTDDGYGGVITTYKDGATITGAMVHNHSSQTQIAEALGSTSSYTLTVRKNVELDYHTIIRREADKQIFRLTSNSDDLKTPNGAGLNMRQYTAEEWKL